MPETVESILQSYKEENPTDGKPSASTLNESLVAPRLNSQTQELLERVNEANAESGLEYTNELPPDEYRQTLALEALPDMEAYLNAYLGSVAETNSYYDRDNESDSNN